MKLVAIVVLLFGLPYMASAPAQTAKPAPENLPHFDFTRVLLGLDGKPLMNGDAHPPVPLTLSDVAVNAVEGQLQSDPTGIAAGADKLRRDKLAMKIFEAKDVVLTSAEIALIIERIGESPYPAVVMGAAVRFLDAAQEQGT